MHFDAIIAGAGIIGSSIAWRLAQAKLRVLLLDSGEMGGEASSAGAGMLAPGGELESWSDWSHFALHSLRLYPEFVAELTSETGCTIDYQRFGAVELAFTDDESASLKTRREMQESLGIVSLELARRELHALLPDLRAEVAAAAFYPDDALVDPRHIMHALRAACLARCVTIREHEAVIAIRTQPGLVRFEMRDGVVEAPIAVLAAGAWSSLIQVDGLTLPHSFPVRGHLMAWQLEPDSLRPIVRHGHTYLLQRAEGFTIAGTSSEHMGFDRELDPAILGDIHHRAAGLLPRLAVRIPDKQWLGFRPAIDGDAPAVGRVSDTALWLAYGHYRNGILMAPATAERVANEITSSLETGSSAPTGSR
jgi:glycine oxidase